MERLVWYLTEELISRGHDVTLFATADSTSNAVLVPCAPKPVDDNRDALEYHERMLRLVREKSHCFDVIHLHLNPIYGFLFGEHSSCVTTMHYSAQYFGLFSEVPLVAISESQRRLSPRMNWVAMIHYGLPSNRFPFAAGDGGYLAFVGRASPEKGLARAISLATEVGIPLKIAATVPKGDREYWNKVIEPELEQNSLLDFVGEIDDLQKCDFLGKALGLLFPIDWPEPFGAVLIEAMSCGTPAIAWSYGAVEEIVEHGVSGYVVSDLNEARDAVRELKSLNRARVRRTFEERFTVEMMADHYEQVYESLISR